MNRPLLIAALSGAAFSPSLLAQITPAQAVPLTPPSLSLADDATPLKNAAGDSLDPASLVPSLPSLRPAKSTLIGGTIDRLDRIQDQLTVLVFGGGKMKIMFDPRTRIYRDGYPASTSDLRRGDRVYIDTVLDRDKIFALNIRLKRSTSAGESQGVVVSYRSDRGELTMRDVLSPHSFVVQLNPSTRIANGDRPVSASELTPGTLLSVSLGPQRNGRAWVRQISVLAVPGDSFTFAGPVTSLDLRLGLLVLTSTTDHKSYEIHFDSGVLAIDDGVHPGVDVTVLTRFEGNRYVARSLTINAGSQP
jgi:hypothetical protein